jgi:hypothetical protein
MSPEEAQKAMEELDSEFQDAKSEMDQEVDLMQQDMFDSNGNPDDLDEAAQMAANEQKTEETMIQDSNAIKDMKFHEKEVTILQSPHAEGGSGFTGMEHGFYNGKLSPEHYHKNAACDSCPEYCPGPVMERCHAQIMRGPACVKCMESLSMKCLKVQINTLCWTSGDGSKDYSVNPGEMFDAAVEAGRPEPGAPGAHQTATSRTLLRGRSDFKVHHNSMGYP